MPLPDSAVKELLSRGFLRLVGGRTGFVPATDELDFGIDFSLRHVDCIEDNGRLRFRSSGFSIDVQLKATCENQVQVVGDVLRYDLDVTAYNDIVRRAMSPHLIPLILGLFVLPDNPDEWLSVEDSALTLRRCTYVWRPTANDTPSTNTSTQRIQVSVASRLDPHTFESIRQEYLP